jgi:hypothetical protein
MKIKENTKSFFVGIISLLAGSIMLLGILFVIYEVILKPYVPEKSGLVEGLISNILITSILLYCAYFVYARTKRNKGIFYYNSLFLIYTGIIGFFVDIIDGFFFGYKLIDLIFTTKIGVIIIFPILLISGIAYMLNSIFALIIYPKIKTKEFPKKVGYITFYSALVFFVSLPLLITIEIIDFTNSPLIIQEDIIAGTIEWEPYNPTLGKINDILMWISSLSLLIFVLSNIIKSIIFIRKKLKKKK